MIFFTCQDTKDCPSASEVTLKDMGKTKHYLMKTKQKKHELCVIFLGGL